MLKKLFIVGAILTTTACGDSTEKYKEEITAYKAKVEAGLKTVDKRLKECATPNKNVQEVKKNFKLAEFEKNWIGPLNEYLNQDKITKEDYESFSSQKYGITQYFTSIYETLESSKC